MPTLTQITQSIMQDPDNQSFTAKELNRFLRHQRQLVLILSDKPRN